MVHLAAKGVASSEFPRERAPGGARDAVPLQSRRDVRLHRLPRGAQTVFHAFESPQEVEHAQVLAHGVFGEDGGEGRREDVLEREDVPPEFVPAHVRHARESAA